MSKEHPKQDVERTAVMLDLIHRRYWSDGMGRETVVLEEVADSTGRPRRFADVLTLGIWKSGGRKLNGYEIKASRADLKTELAKPSKHLEIAKYCNAWSLIIWDEAMLVPGIPPTWGIWVTVDVDGDRHLKQLKKPAVLTPLPWPMDFICSMIRNAYEQGAGAAVLARACAEAARRGSTDRYNEMIREHRESLRPLAKALYGDNSFHWPVDTQQPAMLIRNAVERLKTIPQPPRIP